MAGMSLSTASSADKSSAETMMDDNNDTIVVSSKKEVVTTDGKNLATMIARHVSLLNTDADQLSRKRALQAIYDTLFVEYSTSDEEYCALFADICKTIFKRYNDKIEKCRDLAYRISTGERPSL